MELCTSTASTAITVSAVWCAVGVGAKSGVLCAHLHATAFQHSAPSRDREQTAVTAR
jgi:hypothetical protein